MSDIKAPVREMANLLKGQITIAKDGATTVAEGTYAKTLEGTGLTVEQAEKLTEHNSTLAAATVVAFGELGIDALKANKELDRVSVSIPMAKKDTMNADFFRSKDYPNPKEGGVKTVHGVVTVQHNSYGAGNRGQVKAARHMISEMAAQALA